MWHDLKDHLDLSEPVGICVSSNEDVVSNMHWEEDMDYVKCINFEDVFNFESFQ